MRSTYPGGSRGLGLLLLRAAVGAVAIGYGAVDLTTSAHESFVPFLFGIVAAITGFSLMAGFLTPFAGGLVAIGATIIAFSWFSVPALVRSKRG